MGIFAPDFRASLSAIATACLRLRTFFPLPDRNVPCLCSCITLATLLRPLLLFELLLLLLDRDLVECELLLLELLGRELLFRERLRELELLRDRELLRELCDFLCAMYILRTLDHYVIRVVSPR